MHLVIFQRDVSSKSNCNRNYEDKPQAELVDYCFSPLQSIYPFAVMLLMFDINNDISIHCGLFCCVEYLLSNLRLIFVIPFTRH